MREVALFLPCFVDQFRPSAASATVRVLEKLGLRVRLLDSIACCGQPLWNAGHAPLATRLVRQSAASLRQVERVICPSGSCTAFMRGHYAELLDGEVATPKVFEFCEFLHDELGITELFGTFNARVAVHVGCHAQRELGLGPMSERRSNGVDKVRGLLSSLSGIELVSAARADECCGFGGTFAAVEQAVSCKMGSDRVRGYVEAGATVLVSTDPSCLMHMNSVAQTGGLRLLYIAELLEEAMRESS